MRFKITILILIALFLNIQIASAAENEYGIVKAWFNGKNATVEDANLKIGEPAELKVEVNSKINGHVIIRISEPGDTNAFNVLSGPTNIDDRIDNLNIESGWSKTYLWTITPNGVWKNGNAPINIFVEFNKIENGKIKGDKKIQFTIANPYILDEQYSGAAPTTIVPSPQPTGSPAPTKQAPFVATLVVISALILAWRWAGRHN